MIQSLSIQNYAIIDSLEIDFQSGLSVLTGETGAGKSIILGALGLILGQRAESKIFRDNAKKCVIEGVFNLSAYPLKPIFDLYELEYDPHCIVRREIQPSGKSRAFVNDTPTQLTVLKALGDKLLDIHSQHQNLLLSDEQYQLKVLDLLSLDKQLMGQYTETFDRYRTTKTELQRLKNAQQKGEQEQEYLRFQYNQLAEANLQPGEQTELEEERNALAHAEEIKMALFTVDQLLSEDELGLLTRLKNATNELSRLVRIFPKAEPLAERMESNYIDLTDLCYEVNSLGNKIDSDPTRLEWVNDRLNLLYSLQQKHRVNGVEELIAIQADMEAKLSLMDSYEELIAERQQAASRLRADVDSLAQQLTQQRREQASLLERTVVEKVKLLAIPNIRFEVSFSAKQEPDESGNDDVCYLFAANKNAPLLPVVDTASGGEISRMMLCIKALIASRSAMPTIIFDEIDTGVSGEVANMMGEIMCEMAHHMQVVTITHLPQIAVKGKTHYKVYKIDTDKETRTNIAKLNRTEREEEIARMLSGATLTKAALDNARELLSEQQNN